ncbi:MAG TPA: hypothetical protein PLP11_11980 [Bacteroidales bacterium]|nr:hypothetical protein [Bacteroidales bacterium]
MKLVLFISKTVFTLLLLFSVVNNGFAQQHQGRYDFTFPDGTILSSETGTIRAELKISSGPYDEFIAGIYSANKSSENATTKSNPVVSGGVTLVRFNDESGNIKRGDPVTSSSEPGVAMKATEPGIILGVALEDAGESGTLLKVRVMIQYMK